MSSTTKEPAVNKVVFPGIAAWLRENGVTVGRLATLMGYRDNMQTAVYNALCGHCNPSFATINKILDATGMTFEEAFRKEDPDAQT